MEAHIQSVSSPEGWGTATPGRGADARFAGFFILACVDLASLWAGCLVAFELAGRSRQVGVGFAVIALTYLAVGALAGAFSRRALLSPAFSIGSSVKAATFSIAAVWIAVSLQGLWESAGPGRVALAAGVVAVLMFAGRISVAVLSNLMAAQFSTDLLIVDDVEAPAVPKNYSVIRAMKLGVGSGDQVSSVGFSRLTRLALKADRVLISCSLSRSQFWTDVFDALSLDAAVIVSDMRREGAFDREFETDLPILRISRGPLTLRQRIHKRIFDLSIAVPAFIILTPVLGAIWIYLALSRRRRRVIQTRTILGLRNQPFRTTWFDIPRSQRSRKGLGLSSLARAPMLLDVILGRMSLVGPAPLPGGDGNEAQRLRNLKPGLFKPNTNATGSSYREGWSVWRDMVSFARMNPWPMD